MGVVARVAEAIELAREQHLSTGPGEKREGLRQHEREWRGQQPIEETRDRRTGVFLEPQERAKARGCRHPVLHAFGAKAQPRSAKDLANGSARQGKALPL